MYMYMYNIHAVQCKYYFTGAGKYYRNAYLHVHDIIRKERKKEKKKDTWSNGKMKNVHCTKYIHTVSINSSQLQVAIHVQYKPEFIILIHVHCIILTWIAELLFSNPTTTVQIHSYNRDMADVLCIRLVNGSVNFLSLLDHT